MQIAGGEWTTWDGVWYCQTPFRGQKSWYAFLFVASKHWVLLICFFSTLKAKSLNYATPHFHFKAAHVFSLWSLVPARFPQAQSQCSDGNIVLAGLLGQDLKKVQWDYIMLNLIMREKGIREGDRDLVKWVESCFCLLVNMNVNMSPHWDSMRNTLVKSQEVNGYLSLADGCCS